MSKLVNKLVTTDNLKTFLDQCDIRYDNRYQRAFVIGGSNNITEDDVAEDNSTTTNWVIGTDVPDELRGTSDGFSIISTPVNTPDNGVPTISIPTNLVGGITTDGNLGELPRTTFNGSAYTSIKLSNLSGLTSTKLMFNNCTNLTNLNLIGLDTSNVTDMSNMMSGCSALKNVNINTLNTTSTESMASMFEGDTALESIDLTSFDLRKVTDLSGMFRGCTNLKEITFGNGFKYGFNEGRYRAVRSGDPEGLKWAMNCNGMFNNCYNLSYIDLSWFNPINVFYDGTTQQISNIVYNAFINGVKLGQDETSPLIADSSNSFYHNYIINSGMYWMFKGCKSLFNFILNTREGVCDNNFGYVINGIKCDSTQELYKPIFTICDLSDSEVEDIQIFDKIFRFDRFASYDKGELRYAKWMYNEDTDEWDMSYDRNGQKSLFGIIVSDKKFVNIWNDQSYKDHTWYQRVGTGELTSSRIFFGGYIVISKSNFESSQTSLTSEITVDDGQDV